MPLTSPDVTVHLDLLSDSTGEEEDDADLDAPKVYEPIPSLESLAERLQSYQQGYNETIRGSGMDLVFFKVCAW